MYFIVNWQYNIIRSAVFNSNTVDYLIHFYTINKGDVPRYAPQVCLCHCNIHEFYTKTYFWYCIEFQMRKNFIEKMLKVLLVLFSLFQNRKNKETTACHSKWIQKHVQNFFLCRSIRHNRITWKWFLHCVKFMAQLIYAYWKMIDSLTRWAVEHKCLIKFAAV